MSHLTREKMDKISFLISEVTFKCLGNRFFDTFGNEHDNLMGLIRLESSKQVPSNAKDQCDLLTTLTTEKKPTIPNRNRAIDENEVKAVETKRKRRASTTGHNEPHTKNDPEELFVPMATVPKVAKIEQRRSTICVKPPKIRKQPIIVPANHARKSGPHTGNGPKKLPPTMTTAFTPAKITQNRQTKLVTASLPKEVIDDFVKKRTNDYKINIKQNLSKAISIRKLSFFSVSFSHFFVENIH